jgi:hypothetical protein
MSINATVSGVTNNIVGTVSQGNEVAVTRITVPGPAGLSGEKATKFAELSDIDITNIGDGAMIQYNATTSKFEVKQDIDQIAGVVRLSGGIF